MVGDERRGEAHLAVEREQRAEWDGLPDRIGRPLRTAQDAAGAVGSASAALGPGAAAPLPGAPEANASVVVGLAVEQGGVFRDDERGGRVGRRREGFERGGGGGEQRARGAELVQAVVQRHQDARAHGQTVGADEAVSRIERAAGVGEGGAGVGDEGDERGGDVGFYLGGEAFGGGAGAFGGGVEVLAERSLRAQPVRWNGVERRRRHGAWRVGGRGASHRARVRRSGRARGVGAGPGG